MVAGASKGRGIGRGNFYVTGRMVGLPVSNEGRVTFICVTNR